MYLLSWFGAAADRSIRTPASRDYPSAAERATELGGQATEHALPGIPRQQPVHQLATRVDDLARDANEKRNKRSELHPQHLFLLGAVSRVPSTWRRRRPQRQPGLEVPRQRRHH